jgi:hypothetical protein
MGGGAPQAAANADTLKKSGFRGRFSHPRAGFFAAAEKAQHMS